MSVIGDERDDIEGFDETELEHDEALASTVTPSGMTRTVKPRSSATPTAQRVAVTGERFYLYAT